jgi:hypothetical protein
MVLSKNFTLLCWEGPFLQAELQPLLGGIRCRGLRRPEIREFVPRCNWKRRRLFKVSMKNEWTFQRWTGKNIQRLHYQKLPELPKPTLSKIIYPSFSFVKELSKKNLLNLLLIMNLTTTVWKVEIHKNNFLLYAPQNKYFMQQILNFTTQGIVTLVNSILPKIHFISRQRMQSPFHTLLFRISDPNLNKHTHLV